MASWDRMVVPLPFSRAVFLYGDPISISRDEDVEEARLRVERALNELSERAEHYFDVTPSVSEGPGGTGGATNEASRDPRSPRSLANARDDSWRTQ